MTYKIGEPVELQTSRRSPLVQAALAELEEQLAKPGVKIDADSVKDFVRLKLAGQEREVFAAIFTDCQHNLQAYEEIFYGSVSRANIHFREVVKRALHYNAAAMIVIHNHPSGSPKPSQEDLELTLALNELLGALDIRLLDHLIVGGDSEMKVTSLAKLVRDRQIDLRGACNES